MSGHQGGSVGEQMDAEINVWATAYNTPRNRYLGAGLSRGTTPTPSPAQPTELPRPARPRPQPIRLEDVFDKMIMGVVDTWNYTFSTLRPVVRFRLLRIPLILVLGCFLLSLTLILDFFVVSFTLMYISSTLSSAFAPVCRTPGMPYASMCRWVYNNQYDASKPPPAITVHWADYPALVEVQSKTFEQILDEVVLGSTTPSLSLAIKKGEMATASLIALVQESHLEARETMAEALSECVSSAKDAEGALARLDSKMNGAMDEIMAVNDYALHAIEGASRVDEARKLVKSLIPWRSRKAADRAVEDTFIDVMNVLSEQLECLILEAKTSMQNLDALDEKLNTHREVLAREDASEDPLLRPWKEFNLNQIVTYLGNYERYMELLSDLGNYREAALERVVVTLRALEQASQDMEDMRERVAKTNSAESKMTPEIHMKSIRNGQERLSESRRRAKGCQEEA